IICCGYKGDLIKKYFIDYGLYASDITVETRHKNIYFHQSVCEDWKVTLVDTGLNTMTGGRLKRIRQYVKDEKAFCFTYGDGLSDIDITKTIEFHQKHNVKATVVGAQASGRFGFLDFDHHLVTRFVEKPRGNDWINAGFFVLSPKVFDEIEDDSTIWEETPLENLVAQKQLAIFPHQGFWLPMDTLRDKVKLQKLWDEGHPPWKIWNEDIILEK
ncbi:MAG: sugar phosphate nucleotidyltransferase, partial [Pseudomonadota bacterium]